jgi:hypothetical protein
MMRCCDKEHFIIGFDDSGALWFDRTTLAEDCRDAGIDVWHMLTQRR